ncbi:MAG: 3-deoxy-7-phosphoheptulonate synthase [Chlamydiia bacterium]|nr:3-deoxy-7-phosphoheptulonate synthase [Chlamydiia bacterium]
MSPFSSDDAKSWLPSPQELKNCYPLSKDLKAFIEKSRQEIKNILLERDHRLILIVGPCSIHDLEACREYASYLKDLIEEVSDQFFILMRVYFEKPRTLTGWKGFVTDPHLDGSYDIAKGLQLTRQFLWELASQKIPIATELLEIMTTPYVDDLLSWGCIGARTCTSPLHRQMAAGLPFPVGFKNSTDGNITNAINGVIVASAPHAFMGVDEKGMLKRISVPGNPNCHLILRGGKFESNYDLASIQKALIELSAAGQSRRLIVDCSHDNCGKIYERQMPIFYSLIDLIQKGHREIKGMMLESHLFEGNQTLSHPSQLRYGVSVTDPCLDWERTQRMIHQAYKQLQNTLPKQSCLVYAPHSRTHQGQQSDRPKCGAASERSLLSQ